MFEVEVRACSSCLHEQTHVDQQAQIVPHYMLGTSSSALFSFLCAFTALLVANCHIAHTFVAPPPPTQHRHKTATRNLNFRRRGSGTTTLVQTMSAQPAPALSAGRPNRPGILIVGVGGGNGVTAIAGVIANKKKIEWEGPTGRMSPNYLGCITQLPSKGGSGGYRERYALAHANDCAIGGWDIRATPLGEALYNARILDFDLVRQVREEMDSLTVLPGVWDPDFIGKSQHKSAKHVVGDEDTQQRRVEILREDIRKFREREGVTGHITVIWSASVERPSNREFEQPDEVSERE